MIAEGALSGVGTSRQLVATCLVGGCVEALMSWRFGWSPELPAYLFLGAIGSVASMADLRTRKMPRALLVPSYLIGEALLAIASASGAGWWPLARGAIAMTIVASFFLAEALMFPGRLGLGDVVLGGLLGLFLGWLGWPMLVSGTLFGWLLPLPVFAVRRLTVRESHGAPMALGPFLCLGALVALVLR